MLDFHEFIIFIVRNFYQDKYNKQKEKIEEMKEALWQRDEEIKELKKDKE